MQPFTIFPTRIHLAFVLPLACFIALALSSFTLASRYRAAQARDPFIGRAMPCGDVYNGQRRDIHGLIYFVCERGHPWPQLNSGGLLTAVETPPAPSRPVPAAVPEGVVKPIYGPQAVTPPIPPPGWPIGVPYRFSDSLPPNSQAQLDPRGRVGRRP